MEKPTRAQRLAAITPYRVNLRFWLTPEEYEALVELVVAERMKERSACFASPITGRADIEDILPEVIGLELSKLVGLVLSKIIGHEDRLSYQERLRQLNEAEYAEWKATSAA